MPLPLIDDPHEYDFNLYQGATWRKSFLWIVDGLPVDLTGMTGRCHIKVQHGSASAAIVAIVTIPNATAGEFQIEITDAVTTAIDFTSLFDCYDQDQSVAAMVYDCELTDGTDVVRVLQGKCRFWREVTT